MAFFLVVLCTLSIYSPLISAIAFAPTGISNHTFTNTSSPLAPTACPVSCNRDKIVGSKYEWNTANLYTTITAATVVHVVNTKRNTTRTTTITNTDADLRNFTAPTDTNTLGTRTFQVTDVAADGTGLTTFAVAFPTAYQYYQPSYTINGTLPTKVGANPACLRVPSGKSSAFPFPSHPQLPQYTQVPTQDPDGRDALNERFAQDPKGWTWNPPADSVSPGDVIVENADDFSDAVKPLFPNLGVWSCPSNPMAAAAPEVDVETALYLTQTSTSMESDDGETTTAPQSSVNQASSSQRAPMAAAADQTSAQSSEGTSSKAATSPEQQIATPTSTVLSQGELQGLQQTVPASTLKASTPHLSSSLNAGGVNTLSPLPEVTPSSVVDKPQPITVNGQPITPNAQSLYLVSGQSLALGSSITLGSGTSNTIVALQTSKGDTVLVVGSSSSSLLPAVTPAPVVTIGTRTVQANSQGQYIIGSQTLTAGGVVTISKTPVSLAPGGSQVVVGSSTETVAESSGSVGGAVIAAFQGASNGMAVPRIFSFSFIALALVLNFT